MDFAPLIIQGQRASRIGLGTWALGGGNDWGPTEQSEAVETVEAALAQGINLIDTAPVYGDGTAERLLGQALRGRRHQVLLATKCGIVLKNGRPDHDLRAESICAQCDASLRRLQTDYIDLYQIHWPDPKVPLEQAAQVLARLQEQGKIRAVGLCNVGVEPLRLVCQSTPVACVQNPFSLLDNARWDVARFCRENNIAFYAYGALGGGILSGKYRQMPNLRRCDARRYFYKYYFGAAFEQAQALGRRAQEIAAQRGVPASAVALAWVLAQEGVSGVLAGARSAAQARQNSGAVQLALSGPEKEFLSATVKTEKAE